MSMVKNFRYSRAKTIQHKYEDSKLNIPQCLSSLCSIYNYAFHYNLSFSTLKMEKN